MNAFINLVIIRVRAIIQKGIFPVLVLLDSTENTVRLTYVIQTHVKISVHVMELIRAIGVRARLDSLGKFVIMTLTNAFIAHVKTTLPVRILRVLSPASAQIDFRENIVREIFVIRVLVETTVFVMGIITTTLVHALLGLLDETAKLTLTNARATHAEITEYVAIQKFLINARVLLDLLEDTVTLMFVIQTHVGIMEHVMAFTTTILVYVRVGLLGVAVKLMLTNASATRAEIMERVTTQKVLTHAYVMRGLLEDTVRLTYVIRILVRITAHVMALKITTLVRVLLDLRDITATVTLMNAIVIFV